MPVGNYSRTLGEAITGVVSRNPGGSSCAGHDRFVSSSRHKVSADHPRNRFWIDRKQFEDTLEIEWVFDENDWGNDRKVRS
jgi:hypothetical protein